MSGKIWLKMVGVLRTNIAVMLACDQDNRSRCKGYGY